MSSQNIPAQEISIKKISEEKLSPDINIAIEMVEIEVWEKIRPGLIIHLDKNDFNLSMRVCFSTKKMFAWITGIIGFAFGFVKILNWLAPILEYYYNKSPPLP